jgi:hypothetical protein
LKRDRASQLIGIFAIILGVLFACAGAASFNAFGISLSASERCWALDEPAGVDETKESNVVDADFTTFPLGLHCSWKLKSGGSVSHDYPNFLHTLLAYGGSVVAIGGTVLLIVRYKRWV